MVLRSTPAGRGPGRRFRARIALWALAGAALVGGCSGTQEIMLQPRSRISGEVRLEGEGNDVNGSPTGTLVVANASGVPVYLTANGAVVDSTGTELGGYAFTNFASDTYRVATSVAGVRVDSTRAFAVGEVLVSRIIQPDTLVVRRIGAITCYPNPAPGHCTILFSIPATVPATLTVVDLSGAVVRTLLDQTLVAGFHQVHWDGLDDGAQPVPAGDYWAVFRSGSDFRVALMIRT